MRFEKKRHLILNNPDDIPASNMTVRRTIHPKELKLRHLLLTEGVITKFATIIGMQALTLILLCMFIDSNVVRVSIWTPIVMISFWQIGNLIVATANLTREYDMSEDLHGNYRYIDTAEFPVLFPLLLAWLAEEYHQALHPGYKPGTSEYIKTYGEGQGEQVFKLVGERVPRVDKTIENFFKEAERYERELQKYSGARARSIRGFAELLAIRTAKQLVGALTIQPVVTLSEEA